MREILFRGRRTDNGEWVTGCFIEDVTQKKSYICSMGDEHLFYIEVDPATVGQYVGIIDEEGAKLFDGDQYISNYQPAITHVCELDEVYYQIHRELLCPEAFKIVGNIHENEETMKCFVCDVTPTNDAPCEKCMDKQDKFPADFCLTAGCPEIRQDGLCVFAHFCKAQHPLTDKSDDVPTPDQLGEMVRNVWIDWAKQQDNPKPSWLVPYRELNEDDKEADRQIGVYMFNIGIQHERTRRHK